MTGRSPRPAPSDPRRTAGRRRSPEWDRAPGPAVAIPGFGCTDSHRSGTSCRRWPIQEAPGAEFGLLAILILLDNRRIPFHVIHGLEDRLQWDLEIARD